MDETNKEDTHSPNNLDTFTPGDPQSNSQPLNPPISLYPEPLPHTAPSAANLGNSEPKQHKPTNSPGSIVLQWLTYAFWGWTILAVTVVTGTVLASFISDADSGYFALYPLASALVLLPISIVCDYFYNKIEPQKKTGAASIVMVIHAVLYGLLAIASLVAIVISILTFITNSSNTDGSTIALCTALVTTVLYVLVFLRVLNPLKTPWFRRIFLIVMGLIVGGITVAAIVGPLYKASVARNDRLIESNLPKVSEKIQSYATNNNSLPTSLEALDLEGDSKKLLDSGLIEYTANIKSAGNDDTGVKYEYYPSSKYNSGTTYYYELCATFASEKNSDYYYDRVNSGEYSEYLSIYYHPKGRQCYKLKTTVY